MMGTTLIERAATLRKGIDELEQLRGMAEQAQAFATRAKQLDGPAHEVEAGVHFLRIFRERGLTVPADRERAMGLRAQVKRMADAYREKPDSILASDGQLRFRFWDSLGQFPRELTESLRAAWGAHVDATLPPRQDGLLQTLRGLPGAAAGVEQVRLLWQRTEMVKRQLPQQAGDFEQPSKLGEEITQAMARLTGGNLPSGVQQFIQAATTPAGASLGLLSQDVLDWLERTGNWDAVRVVLRSGA